MKEILNHKHGFHYLNVCKLEKSNKQKKTYLKGCLFNYSGIYQIEIYVYFCIQPDLKQERFVGL